MDLDGVDCGISPEADVAPTVSDESTNDITYWGAHHKTSYTIPMRDSEAPPGRQDEETLQFYSDVFCDMSLGESPYIICTIHIATTIPFWLQAIEKRFPKKIRHLVFKGSQPNEHVDEWIKKHFSPPNTTFSQKAESPMPPIDNVPQSNESVFIFDIGGKFAKEAKAIVDQWSFDSLTIVEDTENGLQDYEKNRESFISSGERLDPASSHVCFWMLQDVCDSF